MSLENRKHFSSLGPTNDFYINGCPCAIKAFKMRCWAHPPGNLGIFWQTPRMVKASSNCWPVERLCIQGRGAGVALQCANSLNGCSHNMLENNCTAAIVAHQHLQRKDLTPNAAQVIQSSPLWLHTHRLLTSRTKRASSTYVPTSIRLISGWDILFNYLLRIF